MDVDAIWKVHASRHYAYECNIVNVLADPVSQQAYVIFTYIMSLSIGSW